MRRLTTFLAGAGAAYLLDPVQGRRRRHVLRDRAARQARRASRAAGKKRRHLAGQLVGLLFRARRLVVARSVATDDRTVEQRIRSDALRDVGISSQDVEVHVERGVVTVRGSVESSTLADDLVSRTRKVPGVEDVAAMLKITVSEKEDHAAAA